MADTVTALTCPQCGATFDQNTRGRPRVYCSRPCQVAARDRRRNGRIVLSAERHDSIVTEHLRLGFRVICGCRWYSEYGRLEDAEAAHDRHLQEVDSDA